MATALVRMIEDQQIVGMFVYKEPEDLFWLVDQIEDPFHCEFIDIKYGGLIWEKESKPVISNKFFNTWHNSDDIKAIEALEDEVYDGAQLDEYSFNQVIDSKWTKITKKFVE
jgi:hypothetical protein